MKLFRQSEKIVSPLYGYIRKGILIMKLTAFLLLVFCMQVSAAVFSQQVTLKQKNVSLETVLKSIRKQTGYTLLYSNEVIRKSKPVSVDFNKTPLTEALDQLFNEQPLTYTLDEKTILVKEKQPSLLDKIKNVLNLDKIDVTGKVVDENNQPLPGATVIVKGTNNSTITDAKGNFSLTKVDQGAALVITFVGYEKKEITAAPILDTVQLKQARNQLDAVQVIAYGETSQRYNVGNVTTVTAKDIEKQPVSNPILALEGRVSGLNIVQSSGVPGSSVTVRIQGQNSLSNGNDPFFVIDGVPYSSQPLQTTPQSSAAGNFSPFSLINPSDIESISVLKDADATAIYGSRAANGAIIITTKKGKAGDMRVNVNLQNGWGHVTRELPVLNTQQYLQMRHEALKNDGLTVQPGDIDINGTWDTTRNTNWQKELIGGTSQYTNLDASISGGSENTQFYVGTTYHRETTVFPGDFDDKKGNIHFNLTTTSPNKKFKFQLTGSYLFDDNFLPGIDLTSTAITLQPNAPALFNADGTVNWALDKNGNSTWNYAGVFRYPLIGNYQSYENRNANLVGNAILSYTLLPGLELKSTFGYTSQRSNEISLDPSTAIEPAKRAVYQRFATYGNSNAYTWITEPQLNYMKAIGRGQLNLLLGATIQQNGASGTTINGRGYSSDLLLENPAAAATASVSSSNSAYKYSALFTRLNFNWGDKYLLNVTGRRDGSSRFGAKNEFHNFGAVGGGWIFSNEEPVKNNFSFLSFGKLKGSYGITGSDQIGDYQFLSLYNINSVGIPYQGITTLAPVGLSNPYLQWEETRKMEFGLELGFFSNRLLLTASYSKNKSSNQLVSYATPSTAGFPAVRLNLPATVQNTDFEFDVNSVNIKGKDFTWASSFNLTIPRNKLVAFPNISSSAYAYSYEIGQSLNILKAFRYAGVNQQTGLYQFKDATGNLTSDPAYGVDNTAIVDLSPKFYGGFGNDFTYKGFQLSVLFQFVKQKGPSNAFGDGNYPGSFYGGNQPLRVFENRWQRPGDQASIQQFSTNNYTGQVDAANSSDGNYADASYIRLKNLALSYQLDNSFLKIIHAKACKLYLQGQNLLTITRYKGLDPESPSLYPQLPPLRVITIGLNVTF